MQWSGWKRRTLLAALVLLPLVAVLYGWLPWWLDGARLRGLTAKDQAGILSADRGDVLKMVAGAGALVALVYTARKHALDREGQVTDRYAKAIAQLASEKLSERIGGIYALERIMFDSARDHLTVVEVLAAFVREMAPLPPMSEREGESTSPVRERPDADVQAAMTVLARRPRRDEPFALDLRRTGLAGLELRFGARLERVDLSEANLSRANLQDATLARADLAGATLTGVRLVGADLARANLAGADLARANLGGATLADARLIGADLSRADLFEATLTSATLRRANLTGADLTAATLTNANLHGATLTGAVSLGAWQLADAMVFSSTSLDDSLSNDESVRARIEACEDQSNPARFFGVTPEPPATSS